MDLSKEYDCIPHGLLIGKLAAYGVDYFSLFFYTISTSNRMVRSTITENHE